MNVQYKSKSKVQKAIDLVVERTNLTKEQATNLLIEILDIVGELN